MAGNTSSSKFCHSASAGFKTSQMALARAELTSSRACCAGFTNPDLGLYLASRSSLDPGASPSTYTYICYIITHTQHTKKHTTHNTHTILAPWAVREFLARGQPCCLRLLELQFRRMLPTNSKRRTACETQMCINPATSATTRHPPCGCRERVPPLVSGLS
jgi:hypothetical protein